MWILIGSVSFLVFVWVVTLYRASQHQSQDINKLKPVLVIAHPDDEVMFFLPLILAIRPNLAVLCLSTGNFDGLGQVRKAEFIAVMKALQIRNYEIADTFPDGWHDWPGESVARYVGDYLSKHTEIDAIVTFDEFGISGHPNHRSINNSLKFLTQFKPKKRDYIVFELLTVGWFRKYLLPPLEHLSTFFLDSSVVHVANLSEPLAVTEYMKLYGSQNVWFRRIYALLSRYAYLNSFRVRII